METTMFLLVIVASQGQPAASEAVAQAYIKQNKIDEALDRYQRRLVNEEQRVLLSRTAIVAKVIIERQVIFRWEFP